MVSSGEPPLEIQTGHTYQHSGSNTDNHLWVVISDPLADQNRVIVVNFTKYRPRKDGTCRIQAGEHEFITEETCVQYLACNHVKLGVLESWLDDGRITLNQPVSADLLKRIQQGAYDSDQTPGYVKAILVEQGLVSPF